MEAETGQAQEDGASREEEVITYEASKVIKDGKSIVWKFYCFKGTKESGAKKDKVFCNPCKDKGQEKSLNYNNSTSSLHEHLKRMHKKELDEAIAEGPGTPKQASVDSYFKPKSQIQKWPKESSRWKSATIALTKFVIKDGRPTHLIECEGFKEFVKEICPEYEVPSGYTITKRMEKMYEDEKEKLKTELKEQEFVAVTSDGGSSSNSASYQDTNVHYITENFELKSKILSVKENKETHTADNYRKNTDEVLEEFNIEEKVVKTVTDNENKMKAAFNKEERNGCVSHIMHKSYEAGVKVKVVHDTIKKIRKIGRKHNKSYKMKYGLERAQIKRGIKVKPIKQDVENRWGSTREATASYLDEDRDTDDKETLSNTFADEFKNCEAINEALRGLSWRKSKKKGKKGKEKLEEYLLTRGDMMRIRNLNKFLTKLDIFSTTLGGNKFVTSSIVMPVVKTMVKLLKVDEEDPTYISQMKEIMIEDFRKRCDDNLDIKFLCKTSALDPRFKNLKVFDDKEVRNIVFEELEAEAKAAADSGKDDVGPDKEGENKKQKFELDFDQSDDEDTARDEVKQEIEAYRQEPAPSQEEDVLAWWRKKKHR